MDRLSVDVELVKSLLAECEGYEADQTAWTLEREFRARGIDPIPVYVELIRQGDSGFAYSLRLLGLDAVVKALPSLLEEPCLAPVEALKEMIEDAGVRGVPALVAGLSGASDEMRELSAQKLGDWGAAAAEAIPSMMAILRDPDAMWTLLSDVAVALTRIAPDRPEVVAVLKEAASREDLTHEGYNPVRNALRDWKERP